jgi:hypothetical protein
MNIISLLFNCSIIFCISARAFFHHGRIGSISARSDEDHTTTLSDETGGFWCHGGSRGEIYFENKNADNSSALIFDTPWIIAYPGQIRETLAYLGFAVLPQDPSCGWVKAKSIKKAGVRRGTLGYRSVPPNGTIWPSDHSIDEVERAIELQFPAAEIALICFFTITGIPLIWGILASLDWLHRKIFWNYHDY